MTLQQILKRRERLNVAARIRNQLSYHRPVMHYADPAQKLAPAQQVSK